VTGAACLHPGGLGLTGRLLDAAGLPAGAAVLDVGCGDGATVALLDAAYGLRATGLDASPERVAQAVRARPDLEFVAGRAESLPFPDACFDAVLCECVLSTLPAPGAALTEMTRVLRPGGVTLVSDVYVRAGGEAAHEGAVAALGRRETIEDLFEAAGLRITVWTDESGALARYLWDLAGDGRPQAPAPERREASVGRRLGYFACVAHFAAATKGAPSA